MNRKYFLQWMMIKGVGLFLMAFSAALLYFIIYTVPMYDLRSLYANANIVVYHTKAVACVGAIPLCIYVMFTGIRVLFSKGTSAPTNRTTIGFIWGTFSVITTFLGFIIAFLIPIGLAFSSYSNCHEEKLEAYYVTNPELCKTIVPNRWFLQEKSHTK